jgi:hypothetical protein
VIPIGQVPALAGEAWTRLRDELRTILNDDLVAAWAYGGTTSAPESAPLGDLDTFVVIRRSPGAPTATTIDAAQAAIAAELGVALDAWYVLEADARRPAMVRHAWLDRTNETWAIDRALFLAGRFVLLHGAAPDTILVAPTPAELHEALRSEVEHLERHVAAGDTDPYEATYAFLNGCRIVRTLETGDAAVSKREAGPWGLAHLPDRWHPALAAAMRVYEGRTASGDEALIARDMAAFVAMVRDRMARVRDGRLGAES